MNATMVAANEGDWSPNPDGAGSFRILRVHASGGVTIEVSMCAGESGSPHTHPGGEELLMLSGELMVGPHQLAQGDYLYTAPGDSHHATAITDTRFVLILPAIPDYE